MYCRRCGAPLHEGLVICPECGSRQRRRFSAVRCAECGGRVALGLTVCPYCGRNVRPAGPRLGLWLAGIAVVAVAVLWGAGKLPVDQVLGEVKAVRERIASVVQVLGPAASSLTGEGAFTQQDAEPFLEGDAEEVVVTGSGPLPVDSEAASNIPEPVASAVSEPAAAAVITATLDVETPQIAATLEATPTAQPSATETATPEPTATETPTATPTEPPPTATAQPTAPPQPAGVVTYKVKSGDTLSSIASQFGIPWQTLAEANKLTSRSVLRVGQELVIPGQGGAAQPQPTAAPEAPRPTATPTVPPPTPVPSLAAPVLRNPSDQTPINGANSFELVWEAVAGLPTGAQYQVMVMWSDQDGEPKQHWWFTSATSSFVPTWLYQRAAQPARKYSWYVTVVQVTTDGKGGEKVIPLSPSSAVRVFYWS
jgi:LysM repeat protein